MKYAIGIDGGGTKTLGILADRDGRVLASASVGGTNHQICGASTAGQRLAGLAFALLEAAGVSTREIGFLCMGLAGADRREDVCLLERHLPEFLREIPHGIWNDVWIAFATGNRIGMGRGVCLRNRTQCRRAHTGGTNFWHQRTEISLGKCGRRKNAHRLGASHGVPGMGAYRPGDIADPGAAPGLWAERQCRHF